ncbi:hypothetical protein PsAD2_02673 [Pseudovibrio axinellae]|uniref:Uncharacterized protein n=1 Tax=Pseudovibrio axinellae TaxID=989403 RepID=A0A165XQE5_9HYPH|nr:hypothetical protein [Pseudovibrio axinellae]KZL17940.1 hypothetical protein PsAD2_02673 [Pseudovibrio axinellae]SER15918.1 hypothetical protein SAMN05421798_106307 [Pseudovibrio axinellae]
MFRLVFSFPWPVYFVLAALVVGGGFYMGNEEKLLNAARLEALKAPMPDVVDASKVTSNSFSAVDEINVAAQVDLDAIYTVSVSGKRTIDTKKTILFAFSPDAIDKSQPVATAFMLETSQDIAAFLDKFMVAKPRALSTVIHVNGESAYVSSKLEGVVEDAAREAGLTLSQNVQFVEPFMQGREFGLRQRSEADHIKFGLFVAALLAGYGVVRFIMTQNKRRKEQVEAPEGQAEA